MSSVLRADAEFGPRYLLFAGLGLVLGHDTTVHDLHQWPLLTHRRMQGKPKETESRLDPRETAVALSLEQSPLS